MSRETLGSISEIHISPAPKGEENPKGGFPMVPLTYAALIADKGIRDTYGNEDRYFDTPNKGLYPDNKPRQLTIITQDAIDRANKDREILFEGIDTRRNIVVSDMSAEELNQLVEELFNLGGILVGGSDLCTPCKWPSKQSGKEGFELAFTNEKGTSTGGIRVDILDSGMINIGSLVTLT